MDEAEAIRHLNWVETTLTAINDPSDSEQAKLVVKAADLLRTIRDGIDEAQMLGRMGAEEFEVLRQRLLALVHWTVLVLGTFKAKLDEPQYAMLRMGDDGRVRVTETTIYGSVN